MESRLATLTPDTEDLKKLSGLSTRTKLPSSLQPDNIIQLASVLPSVFNMLNIRRAIIPAANGHCSARALARYYAALVDGGVVPPPHSSSSKPALGSNPHIPKYPVQSSPKKQKGSRTKKGTPEFMMLSWVWGNMQIWLNQMGTLDLGLRGIVRRTGPLLDLDTREWVDPRVLLI